MKKIILILFGLFIAYPIIGQNINNHWILGNVDLDFSTNPPTANTIANGGKYGYASVSDENGDLLFYFGKDYKVYNKLHQEMFSSLSGGDLLIINPYTSDGLRNPIVIVPHPYDNDKYVVYITQEEFFGGYSPIGISFLKILVINFDNNPNGEIEYVADTFYNDSTHSLMFNTEDTTGLTNLKNSLGENIFVFLDPYNGYKIFDNTPLTNNYSPIPNILGEANFFPTNFIPSKIPVNPYFPTQSSYRLTNVKLKSDHNLSKIAGVVRTTYFQNIGYPGEKPIYTYKFFTADFNESNFSFINFQSFSEESFNNSTNTDINNTISSDIEFSPDSQKLYYIKNGALYVKDLTNLSVPERKLAITGSLSNFPDGFEHLQKDKYGNIWISSSLYINDRNKYLHKINNPNSFIGSSIDVNSIYLNNNTIPQSFGLPFLIPNIQSCIEDIYITATLNSGNSDTQEASNSITASNTIQNNAAASYKAGNSILLSDGFNVEWGAEFRAYIEDCTNYAPRTRKVTNTNESLDNKQNINVRLYPNPNNGNFEVSLSSILNEEVLVEIYDVNSRLIDRFTEKMNDTNLISIKNQNLKSGIYLVKISSQSISETIKFIKK